MAQSSENPHVPPPTPRAQIEGGIQRSSLSCTPLRSNLSRLEQWTNSNRASPSKHNATLFQSQSVTRSPRRSPTKQTFQSVKSVSFTPQKTKQPPRAWERRPATPFIPRDDKQKIWKRVPLEELGVDVIRPAGTSRREHEGSKDYVRVVKKLKIRRDDEEDKENLSFGVRSQDEDRNGDLKRSSKTQRYDFVSMRVEEDDIRGSPKKKLRLPRPEEIVCEEDHDEHDVSEDQGAPAHNDHHGVVGDEEEVRSEDYKTKDRGHAAVGPEETCDDAGDQAPVKKTELSIVTVPQEVQEFSVSPSDSEHAQMADLVNVDVGPSSNTLDLVQRLDDKPHDLHNGYVLDGSNQAEARVEGIPQAKARPLDDSTIVMPDSVCRSEFFDNLAKQPVTREGQVERFRSTAAIDVQDRATPAVEELRSSSPPTILAENVLVDELAIKQAPFHNGVKDEEQAGSEDQAEDPQEEHSPANQDIVPRRISDGETAFLRDFMSRTKAERVAREEQSRSVAPDVASSTDHNEQSISAAIDPIVPPATLPLQLESSERNEALVAGSSPLRRSKRATVTSIPRPYLAPNSIQLKRANGNEFIFTANQTSSLANIAIATKTNTKKNKGTALGVHARLEQLLVERTTEENSQTNEPHPDPSNQRTGQEIVTAKVSNKKRKREKIDIKPKKVLRWNDANLTSYQEAQSCESEEDDIEGSSQGKDEDEFRPNAKLTLKMVSKDVEPTDTSSSTKSVVDDKKVSTSHDSISTTPISSQTRVRRVRRGTSGSVNGTPAPRKRSKNIIEDDETNAVSMNMSMNIEFDDAANIVSSHAAATAIDDLASSIVDTQRPVSDAPTSVMNTTRKSRMPVPSSTAATRRGTTASAQVTVGVAVSTNAASTLPIKATTVKSKNRGEKTPKEQEAENDDALGRRRLRVRP